MKDGLAGLHHIEAIKRDDFQIARIVPEQLFLTGASKEERLFAGQVFLKLDEFGILFARLFVNGNRGDDAPDAKRYDDDKNQETVEYAEAVVVPSMLILAIGGSVHVRLFCVGKGMVQALRMGGAVGKVMARIAG